MSDVMTTVDPWYVTGLVEGEGCFTYSRRPRSGMALYFAVKLTRADDGLLRRLQEFFGGIGTLYRVRPRAAGRAAGYTKAASYYRISRNDQLRRVVEHFDAYPLRGVKAAAFEIWRLMVLLKLEFPRTCGNRLELLAKQLSDASPRNATWEADDPDAGPYRPRVDSSAGFRPEHAMPREDLNGVVKPGGRLGPTF
jgi:hypothetical protein